MEAALRGEETDMLGQDKEHLLRFRKNMRVLISQHVPEGRDVEEVLEGLSEKWNPLFDEVGRKNLIEDVNALMRDFIRPIRASLLTKAANSERIQTLAEQLSINRSLAKITKKDSLRRYIELYILRCLSEG